MYTSELQPRKVIVVSFFGVDLSLVIQYTSDAITTPPFYNGCTVVSVLQ